MDYIDFELMKELSKNSRVTYRELADKLGLSVNSAHNRVQALIDLGIIKQFTVGLTPKALPQIWVRICGISETACMDETVKHLGKNPNTSMIAVAGGNSLYIEGVLRDVSELNKYATFAIREGKIMDPAVGLLDRPRSKAAPEVSLMNKDYMILASLQDNSRKQIVDLARDIGVSAKTARQRLKRMEDNGLIFYGVKYDYTASGDIFALIHLFLKNGVNSGEVADIIKNKYGKKLLDVREFSTMPNGMTIDVWVKKMAELKALQDSLLDEGFFEKVVPDIGFTMHYFDTWCDEYIRKNALLK